MARYRGKRLLDFMRRSARNREAKTLMPIVEELIRQYAEIVHQDRWPLVADGLGIGDEISSSLMLATGDVVSGIICVSARDPQVDLLAEADHDAFIWSLLVDRFADELWDALGQDQAVDEGPAEDLIHAIDRHLWDRLAPRLRWGCGLDRHLGKIYPCIRVTLFYTLGYALLGKTERFQHLLPLLSLCKKAIPVARKKDEPATWLVLTA